MADAQAETAQVCEHPPLTNGEALRFARMSLTPPERLELLHFLGWPDDLPNGEAARVDAVYEVIVRERIAAVLAETVARVEAVTPREAMRPNERRTYWQGVRDSLAVIRGHRDQIGAGR